MNQTPADSLPDVAADARPTRCDGFQIKRLPCCFFLQDSAGKNVLSLNSTSALVWGLCSGEWTVIEIVETLQDSFPDARDAIAADVQNVVKRFVQHDVVTI